MPILLVQSAQRDAQTVNSTTKAFASNLTAGNLIVASQVIFQTVAGQTITTPVDTLGHTYLPIAAQQNTADNLVHLRSFYVPSAVGGADTITADISGTGNGEITLIQAEWSGLDPSSPLSVTPVLAGPTNTTTPSTGNITPAHNGCLLIGVLNAGGTPTTITPAAGWTTVQEYEGSNNSVTLSMIYKIQSTATPEAASWTISPGQACLSHIMALKPMVAAAGVVYGGLGMRGYGR